MKYQGVACARSCARVGFLAGRSGAHLGRFANGDGRAAAGRETMRVVLETVGSVFANAAAA